MNSIKIASTRYPVLDIIKKRWSPRSFADKTISEEDMNTIIEAATWSFSALNEQPWRYIVAYKHSGLSKEFLALLNPGNRGWSSNAAALVMSIQKTTYSSNGNNNINSLHDTGAANILLTLQANSMGIYTHLMEGFSKEQAKKSLPSNTDLEPVVMISMGYPDTAEKLAEPFKTRELSSRSRKGLDEILLSTPLN